MKTDDEIQRDVQDELGWEPVLKVAEIGVSVKNGIVTLSGTVDAYSKKLAAEKAAKRVLGVKAVAEDIEVKLSKTDAKNDTQIAEEVSNALAWHSMVKQNKLKIKVENGWVTLEGDTEWEFQKNAAASAVGNLSCVRGINNFIKVHPKETLPSDVKRLINQAFHRSATIDAANIVIEVIGDKVVLKGTVRSLAEKEDAANAVWMAPGINYVENKLEVKSLVPEMMEL